jgi:transposase
MPQPRTLANAGLHILGADVAKASVTFHDGRTGRSWSVANTPAALLATLAPFAACDWLICETTGGHERPLLAAAEALGLRACRADAARVKAFIASHGGRAKTDPIDAAWLTRYGAERAASLLAWRSPEPRHEAFAELVRHRQDLIAQRTQAKNRRSAPLGHTLHDLLDEQIAFLTRQIEHLEARLDELLRQTPDLSRDEQALRAIPGIGPIAARTLMALLPELGRIGPKQAASLAGLAPHPHESGTSYRRRRMAHGRSGLKPVLFMAGLAATRTHPDLSAFAQRLIQAGKPKRLAIAAVARKLLVIANGTLRDARAAQIQLT